MKLTYTVPYRCSVGAMNDDQIYQEELYVFLFLEPNLLFHVKHGFVQPEYLFHSSAVWL